MTRHTTGIIDDFDIAEPDGFDLMEVIQILRRRWILVFCITAVFAAVALVSALNTIRLYTATAQVRIENLENRIVEFDGGVASRSADSGTIETEVSTIRSRNMAARVVDAAGLMADPEFNPALGERSFDIGEWVNPRRLLNKVMDLFRAQGVAGGDRGDPSYEATVSNVHARIRAQRDGISYILHISFTSRSSAKSAELANVVADQYILSQLEQRFERARNQSAWLSERLVELRDQVRQAETAVATFAAENNLIPTGGATLNEQQLSEINQQLVTARAERAAAEVRMNRVQEIMDAGGDIDALLQVAESSTISTLRTQLTTLRREEAELAGRYGDLHPDLIEARQDIDEVRRQMRLETQRIITSLENDLAIARSREGSLEASLAQVSNVQAENNQAMVRLRELERTAASQQAIYETFLAEFSQSSEQEGLETPGAIVISPATPPQFSSYPNNTRNVILGAAFGFAVGVGLAYFLEQLDRGIRTREQIEAVFGIPQIAAIPLLKKSALREGSHDIPPEDFALIKPLSAFAESLRALRAGISLSNVDAPPKVILFTSSLPNEGKTTTALSTARMAAASGSKVLLIDADLRHPTLHELVHPDEDFDNRGLVEILAGEEVMENLVEKDVVDNLYILFAGRRASNPSDLLESERMKSFLSSMRDQFDFIIIDTAPVLPVIDGRILSRIVDTTVFLVKWNKTPRDAIKGALRYMRDFDGRIAGIVLSQVDLERQHQYGYGSSYYYYNRYREYYAD